MAKLTITINLDNAAFHNDTTGEPDAGPEVACILGSLARGLPPLLEELHPEPMTIRDSNGNTVGEVAIIA